MPLKFKKVIENKKVTRWESQGRGRYAIEREYKWVKEEDRHITLIRVYGMIEGGFKLIAACPWFLKNVPLTELPVLSTISLVAVKNYYDAVRFCNEVERQVPA